MFSKGSEFRRENAFVEPVNEEKGKPVNILRMVGMSRVKMIETISRPNSQHIRDVVLTHEFPLMEVEAAFKISATQQCGKTVLVLHRTKFERGY